MATIRLRGLGYVVVLGLMLLVSMVLSTGLQLASDWAGTVLPIAPLGQVMLVVNELVSFAVSVALFWGVMRLGSGPKPPTRYLVFGAMVGAALFSVGKQAFAWYLSTAAVVSAYGAAGSLVVLLMWIYFTSAILLYAAACARAFGATQPRCSACRATGRTRWRSRRRPRRNRPCQPHPPRRNRRTAGCSTSPRLPRRTLRHYAPQVTHGAPQRCRRAGGSGRRLWSGQAVVDALQGWMRRSSVVLSAFRYACSKPFPGPQGCPWERENRGGAAVICVTQNGWGLPLWFCIAEHPSCLQPLAC
jgi:hypothetical protein